MTKTSKKLILLGVVTILIFGLETIALAQQPAKKGSATKEIGGRVSGITKDYIAVTYRVDKATHTEYEALLPLDKKITLEYVKSLDQVKVGDTVAVQFDEYTEMTKEGAKTFRKAKGVSFIAPAPKEPESEVLGAP